MGYLNFDKDKLVNLSYSLERETLRTNRGGAYSSTTLAAVSYTHLTLPTNREV